MTCAARWIVNEIDERSAAQLASELELPLAICRLLVQRGYGDAAAADRFLHPRLSELADPFCLPDMQAAVERIWQALNARQKITVHGDYDVDGISSTALLVRVLTALGGAVSAFIPHRADDGYGLGVENLRLCAEEYATELMITVDCGTGAVAAADFARQAGIDLIITDHHEASGPIASALAVVNPKLAAGDDDARQLAGVGVAFKLCHALLVHGRANGYSGADLDLRPYLDLVALGTVADIVPLIGENRTLVRYGLAAMEKSSNPGLQALIACAQIRPPFKAYHFGFHLAPRINAAGRIGSALRALEMLLTDDRARADELAAELDSENRARQQIEKQVLAKCEASISSRFDPERDYAIVSAGAGWHRGVVGIVAARIMRKYYRPSIIIGIEDGAGRGSGRSIAGFSLVAALTECADDLNKFGGHDMAAGLDIEAERIPAFAEHFNAVARKMLSPEDLVPAQRIDAWIEIEDVGEELFNSQSMLAPFGQSNPGPVWAVAGVRFLSGPRQVGKGHLKATLGIGNTECDAIGFSMWSDDIPEGLIDVAFKLDRNEFRGQVSYQMNLQSIRPHLSAGVSLN